MSKFVTSSLLVLASSSAIRESLMRKAGLSFTVLIPKVDEDVLKKELRSLKPEQLSLELARAKAASVNAIHPGWLVIGADQVCVLEGEVLGKPVTEERAARQLERLSGKTHKQITAMALYHQNECIFSCVKEAELTMRNLSPEEITAYLKLDKPLSACGSYFYEAHGKHLFASVTGRDDVIFGLPVQDLLSALYEKKLLNFPRAA